MKQFIEVHYYLKDGKREEFYRTLMESGIAAASRAEKGNEKYDYFYSPDNKNELLLIENFDEMYRELLQEDSWLLEEVLKQHWETEHFKALGDLKKKYVVDTVISRYEVRNV